MREVPFAKVESIGNDFVLIEEGALPEDRYADFARYACQRRFGVGSDGLLVVAPGLRMRMFNPDGSEDFCGNGMRAASAYAVEQGWIEGDSYEIVHRGRLVPAKRIEGGFETTLGIASYEPADVPHLHPAPLLDSAIEGIKLSALSTGSTHTIIKTDGRPESPGFEAQGAMLEHHSLFPERTSVIWAWPTGERKLSIRIWERGAGETLGCGTGSSAAAVEFAREWGPGWIEVENPGGVVRVWASLTEPVRIQGPGRVVYRGHLSF